MAYTTARAGEAEGELTRTTVIVLYPEMRTAVVILLGLRQAGTNWPKHRLGGLG